MYTCTLKTNGILGVKNALVQSVYCVIENDIYIFFFIFMGPCIVNQIE